MKTLIIYYSLEGNTRLIAENIASATNADILQLEPQKEIKSKGFMKYVWGGKAAMINAKPELIPFNTNPEDYDTLFIGTPVWAWTYAPSLNTFFSTHKISNKKIALFCCYKSAKGKIFDKMKQALDGNQILGQIDFRDPLKNNTDGNIQKAKEWAKNIAINS